MTERERSEVERRELQGRDRERGEAPERRAAEADARQRELRKELEEAGHRVIGNVVEGGIETIHPVD